MAHGLNSSQKQQRLKEWWGKRPGRKYHPISTKPGVNKKAKRCTHK